MKKLGFIGLIALAFVIGGFFLNNYLKVPVNKSSLNIEVQTDVEGKWIKTGISENNVKDVFLNNGNIAINLDEDGTKKFSKATSENIGKKIAFMYNGMIVSMPIIQSKIDNGTLVLKFSDAVSSEDVNEFKAHLLGYYYKPFESIQNNSQQYIDTSNCGMQNVLSKGTSMTDYGFNEDSQFFHVNSCQLCEEGKSCSFICLSEKCTGDISDEQKTLFTQKKFGLNKVLKKLEGDCYWFEGNADRDTTTDSREFGWLCKDDIQIRGISYPL